MNVLLHGQLSSITTTTWLSEDTSEHPQSNSCNNAACLCVVTPSPPLSVSTFLPSLSVSVHICQACLSVPLSKDMCDPSCPSPEHTLVTVEASYKHYLSVHLNTMDCQHNIYSTASQQSLPPPSHFYSGEVYIHPTAHTHLQLNSVAPALVHMPGTKSQDYTAGWFPQHDTKLFVKFELGGFHPQHGHMQACPPSTAQSHNEAYHCKG